MMRSKKVEDSYPSSIKIYKTSSIIGIIFPLYYVILIALLGLMWEGYNPITQLMSELGAVNSPFSPIVQFLGFSAMGIVIFIFSFVLYNNLEKDWPLRIGIILLIIAGISMVFVGFFPCDAGCVDVTETGRMHTLTATIPAITMPTGIFFFTSTMKADKRWESKWWKITLILALTSLLLAPLGMLENIDTIQGFVQRLGITFPLLWMGLVSIKLFKLQKIP
jgi:hypothetical membrane protein